MTEEQPRADRVLRDPGPEAALPPRHGSCQCACHQVPGIHHVVPCCFPFDQVITIELPAQALPPLPDGIPFPGPLYLNPARLPLADVDAEQLVMRIASKQSYIEFLLGLIATSPEGGAVAGVHEAVPRKQIEERAVAEIADVYLTERYLKLHWEKRRAASVVPGARALPGDGG